MLIGVTCVDRHQDVSNEIQEALGTSYATPDMDDDELMDELDALEGDLLDEALGEEGPSYLTVRVTAAHTLHTHE